MKTTGVMMAALAVAYAAAPDKSFKLPVLQSGYARSCRGADTLTVSSTPKALTWRFSDFGSSYPDTSGSSVMYCVMVNNLGDPPEGWRFAVDNVEMTGKGKLTGGAQLDQLGTWLALSVAYVTNPGASVKELIWGLRSGGGTEYDVRNTTLTSDEKDLDGEFNIKVPSKLDNWSPCWPGDVNSDLYEIELSHQTYFYMGKTVNATDPKGNIDENFQVAINLKWEQCDPSVDKLSEWGKEVEVSPNWAPNYCKDPEKRVSRVARH